MTARQTLSSLVVLGAFLAGSDSPAQIIATSIPRGTTLEQGQASRLGVHFMASPFARWNINVFEAHFDEKYANDDYVVRESISSADPYSSFLLAAEETVRLGRGFTFGLGGWYNKVGETTFGYKSFGITYPLCGSSNNVFVSTEGDIDYELSYAEVHASLFYRYVGIQAGRVLARRTLKAIRISSAVVGPLDANGNFTYLARVSDPHRYDLTYSDKPATSDFDYDVFAVARVGPVMLSRIRLTASGGAGVYHWDATDKTVFSAFASASLDVYKGLCLDASFWYVGKTKLTELQESLGAADNLSRYTLGIGYTFGLGR